MNWSLPLSVAITLLVALTAEPAATFVASDDAHGEQSALSDSLKAVRQLLQQGHTSDAEAMARHLLQGVESASNPDSVDIAHATDMLVEVLVNEGLGPDPETRRLALRSLGLKERNLPAGDPSTAKSLHIPSILMLQSGE